MNFRQWLKLIEGASLQDAPVDGGGMGNPGTSFPDGQKPSDSKALGNKGKLDNSGMSGGPGRRPQQTQQMGIPK